MLIRPKFDTEKWAEENFHNCDLGDQRRGRRLELFAGQAAKRSAASLPKIGEDWGGTKGIYRLLDRPEATLESVTQAHRDLVRQKAGRFLITCDTTHVDLGCQRKLPDAGPIGPGAGQQFPPNQPDFELVRPRNSLKTWGQTPFNEHVNTLRRLRSASMASCRFPRKIERFHLQRELLGRHAVFVWV
jgi:hypothetical protein